MLVMSGVAPWAKKLLTVTPTEHDFFDLRGPAVYCLVSPWCTRLYMEKTVRGAGERWWEHIPCTESGNNEHAPKLYTFLKVFRWQKYLVLPLAAGIRDGLQVLEKTLIHRFSPALNVVGRYGGTKQKARPGKRERQKGKVPIPSGRSGLLSFSLAGQGKRHYNLAELLEDAYAAGKRMVKFESSGGEVWGEKWSVVRRKLGTSTVAGEKAKLPLGRSKLLLEEGGMFRVAPIVKTESAWCRGKGYLRLLLELPRKRAELKYFDVSKLVFLYRCAREFKTKTSRRTLKEMIAAVIKKKTGVNIKLKINARVKYSHRVIQHKTNGRAKGGRAILGGCHEEGSVSASGADAFMGDCIGTCRGKTDMFGKQAWQLAAKLSHLVVVPVDRNQGDVVIMCPSTYHHDLQLMFNLNVAYQQVSGVSEKEVLARVRTEFKDRDLQKLGAWNPKAKLGQVYVLPKHKDLLRWRPIAPANAEGSKTAGRRLARALNFLLKRVPKAKHFNLKVTTLLKQNLKKTEKELSIFGENSMALVNSFDIKEMFTSLPHQEIVRVTDWLLQQWEARGVFKMSLSRRGRVVILNRKSPGPGYVTVKFSQIRRMVSYELENTYIVCTKKILKQVVGIPMGENSSSSLACILCAKYEVDFINALGADQRLIHGVRLVDDVTIACVQLLADGGWRCEGADIT
ncbi:hypothetical protein CBR_g50384 [Chara braunii]|uniref:Reverse transcriptase domain-containing protein n=1 Tax=Chara braunii TaxID=69332 RepID=A0A388M6U3_CHABU|nr:hypothetical protein CBR_g50384 [Chara braunii]|eukprot:GBG90203.1 hypothetical protein CBR_g50384 [Chara braunii]